MGKFLKKLQLVQSYVNHLLIGVEKKWEYDDLQKTMFLQLSGVLLKA